MVCKVVQTYFFYTKILTWKKNILILCFARWKSLRFGTAWEWINHDHLHCIIPFGFKSAHVYIWSAICQRHLSRFTVHIGPVLKDVFRWKVIFLLVNAKWGNVLMIWVGFIYITVLQNFFKKHVFLENHVLLFESFYRNVYFCMTKCLKITFFFNI